MTSNTPEAVDLVSLSHTADVRLFKVLAFGNNANSTRPLTLKDRGSYHHKDTIAEVRWEVDGIPEERTMNQGPRTRVVLNGEFRRKEGVEIRPSFSQGDLTLRVCNALTLAEALRSLDIDVFHSTSCASSHSARHTSDLRATRKNRFGWPTFLYSNHQSESSFAARLV
jgi:hypothetical protein